MLTTGLGIDLQARLESLRIHREVDRVHRSLDSIEGNN